MKIVMISDFFNENLEYQENLLARYYKKHGHDVTIITSTFNSVFDFYADKYDPSAPSQTYEAGGCKIIKLKYKYNILNRVRPLASVYHLLNEEKPDLIFVHEIIPNLIDVAKYIKKHKDCRAIMDYHSDYSNSGRGRLSIPLLHKLIRKRYLDAARPYLSKVFPIVPASFTFLNEVYGLPLKDMELLPLGADVDVVDEVKKEGARARIREALGIPQDSKVIFSGGKFEPRKRLEVLIEALGRLQDSSVHTIVVGDAGDKFLEYKKQVLELAKDVPNLHFVGWLEPRAVYEHLAAADLAVFAASQSIMWQQAIGSGLPLVVGNSGNQSISYLNFYDNIIILEADLITGEAFANTIQDLLSTPSRLDEMSRGAARVTREHLDWNTLINRTLRFNETVAA
jgi:1,2-diacylglycerol 3-alpha-glucosyltransferase